MKPIACIALIAVMFCACKSDRHDPLVGAWKLTNLSATPAAAGTGGQTPGTIYTFRADSTLTVGAMAPQHYELQRLPEGMFLVLGDSVKSKLRVVAMTPEELGLAQDRGNSTLNLKLEFQH